MASTQLGDDAFAARTLGVRPGLATSVRALHGITAALVVLYLGSTIFRDHPSTISF